HHAAPRAIPQPLRHAGTVLQLPLFRDPQAAFPAARASVGRVSRRLRHARRNIRGPVAGADPQAPAGPGDSGRRVLLAAGLQSRIPHRRGRDRPRGPRSVLVRGIRRSDLARHSRLVRSGGPAAAAASDGNGPMRLSFHGADRDVTGSCHLLEVAGKRILVDCGMLQGGRELAEQNAGEFGFDASSVDVVLLTHAHLDHCGRLPLLVKRGFKGEILATSATQELARLVLLDAANLQEEEARRAAMHTRRRGVGAQVEPLYSIPDALNALGSFGRAAPYNAATPLGAGIDVTFYEAGHILGSASVLVEATEGGTTRTILFSGDIGNAGRPLLRAPSPPARADF